MIEWCEVCNNIIFSQEKHSCPPAFRAWCPYYGQSIEDGETIYTWDYGKAAEEWAAWYDSWSADYSIVGGDDVEVCVRGPNDSEETKRFIVSGRSEPVYTAKEIT